VEVICTHENADFDALAALVAARKLYPTALAILPERLNQNVTHFLTLYRSAFTFHTPAELRAGKVTQLILVDTQRLSTLKGIKADTPTLIVDHHEPQAVPPHQQFAGEPVGAATTLLVEQLQQQGQSLTSLEATLFTLGIYEDTGSLTYGTTTARDLRAAAWLLDHQADLDVVRRFLAHPLTEDQQALLNQLITRVEVRTIQGYVVTVTTAEVDHYVSEISAVVHRLRDLLDGDALFALVQMPQGIQLVARSATDSIDSGEIARHLGGGGHARAAAASIRTHALRDVVEMIWYDLALLIEPTALVAEVMSYSRVQTVQADQSVSAIARQLRQIGHEGYPVMEADRVVGLLTRRELDRANEHGLGTLTVRQIMTAGTVTLSPQDSVAYLEQTMVESGWGQIPVVDGQGTLIGIVTRTDLIRYWSRTHPATRKAEARISPQQISQIQGQAHAALIQAVAAQAQSAGLRVFLVGGLVRDLRLGRPNFDVDFVVEGDAIAFADQMRQALGGTVTDFKPFGTAKWSLDQQSATHLNVPLIDLPDHVDFASARYEFYEHPTALPTVYNSSIKLDLQRRDFTINTLALQVSPDLLFGRIVDEYGGQRDLEAKRIRVLHSLSFIDDPTRILRAHRFAARLNFTIEPRTADLVQTALPMLGRITGERLRNELHLLLQEQEPEHGLQSLQQAGILTAIESGFVIQPGFEAAFQFARTRLDLRLEPIHDPADFYWHLLAAFIPSADLPAILDRLMCGKRMTESLCLVADLHHRLASLTNSSPKPSEVVTWFSGTSALLLTALKVLSPTDSLVTLIDSYWTSWRHVRPTLNGNHLQELGVPPGRCIGIILERLRVARLDGLVTTDDQERQLVDQLIHQEGVCRDIR
jgi:tRNA nucleotidyltransferase (CCA-adding enzyme)